MVTVFSLGYKGYYALTNLNEGYLTQIDCVVIGRDDAIEEDFADRLFEWCQSNEIKTEVRQDFSFAGTTSSHFLLMGWKWMVPVQNNTKIIVFHDSLLPKYRGFNPLVTALIEGEREIGATVIFADEEFDKGDIIIQKSVWIEYPIKINEAITLIAGLYLELLGILFEKLYHLDDFESHPQNESEATYSLWRDEKDYKIDWSESSERILRKIHASGFPYKGAFAEIGSQEITILDGFLICDLSIVNRDQGKIIFRKNGFPVVVCGKGLMALTDCQTRDGKPFDILKLRSRLE